MNALIMMLFNIKSETYHPIFYFESPFCGEQDALIRFKSKGHLTIGFTDREDALNYIDSDLIPELSDYVIYKDLDDGDLPWDGEDIPADVQIRSREFLTKNNT